MKFISDAKVGFKMKLPKISSEILTRSDKMLFRLWMRHIYE